SRGPSDLHDVEEVPLAVDAAQRVRAGVGEHDARARDEVLDRARDEDLAGSGVGGDAGADMQSDPCDLAVDELALAAVQPGADLEPELGSAGDDRRCAPYRPRGPVEGGEEAVARRVDLPPAEAHELAADERSVALEEPQPLVVT